MDERTMGKESRKITGRGRKMRKMKELIVAIVCVGALASAEVIVNFTNELAAARGAGTVTLAFTVDGSGNVTLASSKTGGHAEANAPIEAWSGPVGTIDWEGAWNTSFSIVLEGHRSDADPTSGRLQLGDTGEYGGFGVGGGAGLRVDRDGIEWIVADVSLDAGTLLLNAVRYENVTSARPPDMVLTGAGDPHTQTLHDDGEWDVSGLNIVAGDGGSFVFTTVGFEGQTDSGYALAGLSFTVIPEPATVGMLGLGAVVALLTRRIHK